jgi:2-dehydropantoate 2-reductase
MKIVVLGAGALGGYFGGRLLQAGRDVRFVVRPARAQLLSQQGLIIRSPVGDVHIERPPVVTEAELKKSPQTADLVLLSCKAYDLGSAMDSIAPAVGPNTVILPLLNGMRHMDVLAERFGKEKVIGGICLISAALDEKGVIHQFNEMHELVFGPIDDTQAPTVNAIAKVLEGAGFKTREAPDISQRMWEKWVFIASLASLSTLFRASVGEVVAAGGAHIGAAIYDECARIAAQAGHGPRQTAVEQAKLFLAAPGSPITASMFKDMRNGTQTEAEHIIGDMLARRANNGTSGTSGSEGGAGSPLLEAALLNLRLFEAQRLAKSAKH